MKTVLLSLCLILVLRAVPLYSLDLTVALYHDHLVQSVLFTVVEGRYQVKGSGTGNHTCGSGTSWYIVHRDGFLYVRDQQGEWSRMTDLSMIPMDESSVFSLKPADPVLASQEYGGGLQVDISTNGLRLLNRIELERYIMGVTETEAGPACPLEYYKVQAILCRTFALKNIERHLEEGFNLCDGVHCQSYKGRHIWNEDVEIGTEVTDGLVICDEDSVLINPVYHSNSGGETRGAEKVWLKPESYLRPVLDPFSLGQKNAEWERSIQVRNWIHYLLSYEIRFPPRADTAALEMRLKHRQEYYRVFGDSLAVSLIRDDFNYRSDFFDVILDGDMIRIMGRGYGHGVGLSQEGAMEMARRRYHYTAILNYYYHRIQILPYFFLETDGKLEGNDLFSH